MKRKIPNYYYIDNWDDGEITFGEHGETFIVSGWPVLEGIDPLLKDQIQFLENFCGIQITEIKELDSGQLMAFYQSDMSYEDWEERYYKLKELGFQFGI